MPVLDFRDRAGLTCWRQEMRRSIVHRVRATEFRKVPIPPSRRVAITPSLRAANRQTGVDLALFVTLLTDTPFPFRFRVWI